MSLIQKMRTKTKPEALHFKQTPLNYIFKFVGDNVETKNSNKSSIVLLNSSLCKNTSKMAEEVRVKQ